MATPPTAPVERSSQSPIRRGPLRWPRGLSCAVLVVALVGASCSGGSKDDATDQTRASAVDREAAAGAPKAGGELTVALTSDTNSLNPALGQWLQEGYLLANAVYDPLAAFDESGIAKPYLAESFIPSGDFKTWTIKLRSGIQFHNGEPLNADALILHLQKQKESVLGAAWENVTAINKADELSVVLTMDKPWATFPAALALQGGYVPAPAMLNDPAGADAKAIGTGPFEIVERRRDDKTRLKRNQKYWRKDADGKPLPHLEAITFTVIADHTARSQALEAGDVAAIQTANEEGFQAATKSAGSGRSQLISNAAVEQDELVFSFNTTKAPFNDPIARRAVATALDQVTLASQVADGAYPAAWGMFEERSPYYISKEEAGYPSHDVEQARKLADQYRQAHGQPLEFVISTVANTTSLARAQLLQAQLKEAGINATIDSADRTTLLARVLAAGDFQAVVSVQWSSPTPDQSYMFLALPPSPTGFSINYTRFDDPPLRAAMDEFRAAADPKVRIEAFKRVQKQLAANQQMLFLSHERQGFAYADDIYGVQKTTFPGSTSIAYNPQPTTPFYINIWRK